MSDDIELRTATNDDVDAIMQIERDAFDTTAWSAETMAAEIASEWGRYVVATARDAIVGYAGLRAVGVEGDVQTIAVSPTHRGGGLGRRLLAELEREARMRGVRELFLDVRDDNAGARALYEDIGFVEIGRRPGYYQPDNVDAIAMRKALA